MVMVWWPRSTRCVVVVVRGHVFFSLLLVSQRGVWTKVSLAYRMGGVE